MTEPATTDLPLWDWNDASLWADPYPALHRVRSVSPVCWHREVSHWVVTGYPEAARVLRSPHFGVGAERRERLEKLYGGDAFAYKYGRRQLVALDPPEHTKLRALVNSAFTRSRLERLRPFIRQLAATQLDGHSRGQVVDLTEILTQPLPWLLLCKLLGISEADGPVYNRWRHRLALLNWSFADADSIALGRAALRQAWAHTEGLLKARSEPGDEDGLRVLLREWSRDEWDLDDLITAVLFALVSARDLLANGLVGLLRHPDQFELLADDPHLIPLAVEECARFDSSFVYTPRAVLTDTRLGGVDMVSGEMIVVVIIAANRDPARFPQPDSFVVTRKPNPHLTFGLGPHACIGAPLVRMAAECALEALIDRFPGTALLDEPITWRTDYQSRTPVAIRVRLG